MKKTIKIVISVIFAIEIILLPRIIFSLNPGVFVYNIIAFLSFGIFFSSINKIHLPKRQILSITKIISFVCILLPVLLNLIYLYTLIDFRLILSFVTILIWILFALDQYMLIKNRSTKILCILTIIFSTFVSMTYAQFGGLTSYFHLLVNHFSIFIIGEMFYISIYDIAFISCIVILILRVSYVPKNVNDGTTSEPPCPN
jgi:hypothetical protein